MPQVLIMTRLPRRVSYFLRPYITRCIGRLPEKLHGFLNLNDRDILTHAGKISHELALAKTEQVYEDYNIQRIAQSNASEGDFEKAIKNLPTAKEKRNDAD